MRSNPGGSSSIGGAPLEAAIGGSSREVTPAGLLLIILIVYFVIKIWLVVELTLVAVLYATVIEYPVRAMQRHGFSRRAAIVLIDVTLVAGLVLSLVLLAPAASREFDHFRQEEPVRLRTLDASWQTSSNPLLRGPGRRVVERAISVIEEPSAPPSASVSLATRLLAVGVSTLVCLTIAFYFLMEKELLRGLLMNTVNPNSRPRVERIWAASEQSVGGWIRVRLLLGLIVGIGSTIVFGLLGLPYWPLLGLLAGVTEPVPILGPWIGGIPAGFLALTKSFWLAPVVAGFILIRQALVDAILVPLLTKQTVGLSPLVVFVAVLAGTELFGLLGALLAIPIAAVIQVLVTDYFASRRVADTSLAPTWSWLRPARPFPPESERTGNQGHDA
ncbi:MAG: AI-2E family transporter [Thermomicrobiales bacterium]